MCFSLHYLNSVSGEGDSNGHQVNHSQYKPYSGDETETSANSLLRHTHHVLSHTHKYLIFWMAEVSKMEDWDTYEILTSNSVRDSRAKTIATLALALLITHVGGDKNTLQYVCFLLH